MVITMAWALRLFWICVFANDLMHLVQVHLLLAVFALIVIGELSRPWRKNGAREALLGATWRELRPSRSFPFLTSCLQVAIKTTAPEVSFPKSFQKKKTDSGDLTKKHSQLNSLAARTVLAILAALLFL